MRQFILAGNVAYPSTLPITIMDSVAITYLNNGVETLIKDAATAAEFKTRADLVFTRGADKFGPTHYPLFKKNFYYTKGEYIAPSTYSANITIPNVNPRADYTIIIAKKGIKFNERNKWTSTIHSSSTDSASTIAEKLGKHINSNSVGHGTKAVVEGAKITITAVKSGVDYELIPADELINVKPVLTTSGFPGYGSAEYVRDLANKAAADNGFEYTYNDFEGFYPGYDINPLANPNKVDVGYTIFTIRFAEPRETKTVDQAVNQIIQIAFPTGAAAINTLETILDAICGKTAPVE